jgi:hypothetical protein
MVYTSLRNTFMELKILKLLTGLTSVLKENFKYAQSQNIEVKQIFVTLFYTNIMATFLLNTKM